MTRAYHLKLILFHIFSVDIYLPKPLRCKPYHHLSEQQLKCNILTYIVTFWPVTRKINRCLLNVLSANLRTASITVKVGKMLPDSQTAWIGVRRRATRRFNQVQAVCIWNVSCEWRTKS